VAGPSLAQRANRCQGAKARAVGRKAACLLKLRAKSLATGTLLDPKNVARCRAKFDAVYAELERGECVTNGDAGAIEAKVDAFVDDVIDELTPSSSPTTTTTVSTTSSTVTTTTTNPGCCPATRLSATTGYGRLVLGTLTAFPFPSGISITLDVGGGDAGCKHDVVVLANGFSPTIFCLPATGFTMSVTPVGCESGNGFGDGSFWDGTSTTADADVTTVGDTSDGVCNPAGQPCNITAGGASNNSLGDIDVTIGDGVVDPAGVQVALAIPVEMLAWSAANASCPDSDGMYNPGTDTEIWQFRAILRPTTASANASFVDKNADSCSRGTSTAGPNATRTCANDHSLPCGTNSDCPGSSCGFGAILGSPAAGPCCTAGQSLTLAATGIAFSGGSPLFDLLFASTMPVTVDACAAPVPGGSCVVTTNACQF
jgi:hypothetical protein